MGFLDELLSGGQRQKDYRDFVSRYDQGIPQPFAWSDIEGYMRVMRVDLSPWQVDQLFTMDDYAILAHGKAATQPAVKVA